MYTLKKISGYLFFVLLLGVSLICLIHNFSMLDEIKASVNALQTKDDQVYLLTIYGLEISLDIILFIAACVVAGKTATDSETLGNSTIFPLGMIAGLGDASLFITLIYLSKHDMLKEMPKDTILTIILTSIAFILLIISRPIDVTVDSKSKKTFGIIGSLFLLANNIISMISLSDTKSVLSSETVDIQNIINILYIVVFIVSIVLILTCDEFVNQRRLVRAYRKHNKK